jgi:hypothetical protein
MTQFDSTFGEPGPQEQKTSGLAIASLVCSLILCCPITTILGPLLGIAALIKIGGNPALKGRGLAVAGIILGVAFTIFQVWGGTRFYHQFIVPVLRGPEAALAAGFAGDTAGFKAGFYGPGAPAGDAEVTAFVAELRGRYGEFTSCRFDESRPSPSPSPGQTRQRFPYVLVFEQKSVSADAEMIFFDEAKGQMVMKWESITISDPDLGDLTYPASAEGEGEDDDDGGEVGDPDADDGS